MPLNSLFQNALTQWSAFLKVKDHVGIFSFFFRAKRVFDGNSKMNKVEVSEYFAFHMRDRWHRISHGAS